MVPPSLRDAVAAVVGDQADPQDLLLARSILGAVDPATVASDVEAFVGAELGREIAGCTLFTLSVGAVFGLVLDDGSRVVLKAHAIADGGMRSPSTLGELTAVYSAQARFASAGFPCARVVCMPRAWPAGAIAAMTYLEGDPADDPHHPSVRRAMAEGLWRSVELGRAAGDLNLPRAVMPVGSVFPPAHNALFDLHAVGGEMVAITMAGPTAASPEMIMPTSGKVRANPQMQFVPYGGTPSGITPEGIWNALCANNPNFNSTYQNSCQDFIDAWWNWAIPMYERVFSGVTLVLTPSDGHGLPSFWSPSQTVVGHTGNSLWDAECAFSNSGGGDSALSCEAVASITSNLITTEGGANRNGMAAQTAGLTGTDPLALGAKGDKTDGGGRGLVQPGDFGVAGMRYIAWVTQDAGPCQVVAGAQLDHQFADCPDSGYCQGPGGGQVGPEQMLYNVGQVFTYGTAAAPIFGGPSGATAPLNYLNVFWNDVSYAQGDAACEPVWITDPISGAQFSVTAQDELNWLNQALGQVGEPPYDSGVPSPPYCGPHCIACSGTCPNPMVFQCLDGCCVPWERPKSQGQ